MPVKGASVPLLTITFSSSFVSLRNSVFDDSEMRKTSPNSYSLVVEKRIDVILQWLLCRYSHIGLKTQEEYSILFISAVREVYDVARKGRRETV